MPGLPRPTRGAGLGWDVQTGQSVPRGGLFGPTSFGHTGFTGTSLWIDPETQTFVVILTSRLHPDGRGASPSELRFAVATLAAAAITDASARPLNRGAIGVIVNEEHGLEGRATPDHGLEGRATPDRGPQGGATRCGIDVLVEQKFRPLRNKKVGLVTNHTGRTRGGASTIDVLFRAPDVKLVKLFSPEHGIRGEVDASVPDGVDEATGLPVISLYGKSRKPQPKDLEGIDVLVYDIQDIGARFYTYISTLGLVLEAAKESNKAVLVLDRPDPIGGREVSGPVRDDEFASFIAYHPLPVRHGMTVGELARLYNAERKIGAMLDVIACTGWSRDDLHDRTGLVWINPSPNMRSLTEALIYPGVGLLEATNLATGRGTDTPFERVGAPWIDPQPFAAALNAAGVPGDPTSCRSTSPRRSANTRASAAAASSSSSRTGRGSTRSGWGSRWRCSSVHSIPSNGSRTDCSACSPTGRPMKTSSPGSRWMPSWPDGSRSWMSSAGSASGICSIDERFRHGDDVSRMARPGAGLQRRR